MSPTSPTMISGQTSFGMSVIGNPYSGQYQTSPSTTSSIPRAPVQNGYYSPHHQPPTTPDTYSGQYQTSPSTTSSISRVPVQNGYYSYHRPPTTPDTVSSSLPFPTSASSHMTNPMNPMLRYPYPIDNDFQAATTLQPPVRNVHYPTTGPVSPSYHRSPVVPATAPSSLTSAISDQSNPPMPMPNPSSPILPTYGHEPQPRDVPRKQVRPMVRQQSMVTPPSVHASQKQIGSPAMTKAGMSRRKKDKDSRFFCRVPGCRSQGFTEAHNLSYHNRCHQDERPFGPCPKCGKYFRARGDLKRHVDKSKRPCSQ
ncbi:hypothetical protein L218DRAFT_370962 [Marasmius fiardii PR-910]|nr:hypothetical protein L218DRAFT_370962 [Marasmius fiardii PR-910]